MSFGVISTIAGAAVAWVAVAIFDQSATAAAEVAFHPVAAAELCVTCGSIESLASGKLRIIKPKVRAVMSGQPSRAAELSFTFLGPTRETARLASGELRRQLGLKLRAQNSCNVVYVMWRIDPQQKLVVQVKRNPSQSMHAECKTSGYRTVKPIRALPVPVLSAGSSHRLRATIDGEMLRVQVDSQLVWEGELGSDRVTFDGPVGLRTDNAAVEFTLLAGPPDSDTGQVSKMVGRCHSIESAED